MKQRHLLFCFLAMFIINTVNSQTYYPLPTQNAYWTVYEWDENRLVYDDIVYTVDGDTLLNNLHYTKVYKLNDHPTIFDTVRTLHCFMRQNNEEKKIWFIRHYLGETTEKLGYDLSIPIGDTVSLPAFDYGNVGDSIFIKQEAVFDSSKIINGTQRARYFFTLPNYNGYQIEYVEGISDFRSTFPNRQFYFDPFHQSLTVCMHENGNYIWPANEWPIDSTYCGFYLVSTQDCEIDTYKIYPNPATNYINIDIPTSFTKVSCELIDLVGNQIKKTNFQFSSNPIHFDLSTYPSGVYILVTRTLISTYYSKLIINH